MAMNNGEPLIIEISWFGINILQFGDLRGWSIKV